MNQFNLGQRQIGEEKIKRFQIILLTESRRAGKQSIKKLSIYVSPQKDFDRHDKKNATYTSYEK